MYVILWEYQVKADRLAEFEKIYVPDGDWAELFKNGAGFLGTELIHSKENPKRYITIDRWRSSKDYEAFLSQWEAEYVKLDEQCKELTEHESCLGSFVSGIHKSR